MKIDKFIQFILIDGYWDLNQNPTDPIKTIRHRIKHIYPAVSFFVIVRLDSALYIKPGHDNSLFAGFISDLHKQEVRNFINRVDSGCSIMASPRETNIKTLVCDNWAKRYNSAGLNAFRRDLHASSV
jgi:hypothetical protein